MRRALALMVLLALLGAVAACTSPARTPAAPRTTQRAHLVASATQFRPDEGTNRLHAGVTNLGPGPVRVSAARVLWRGFTWSPARVPSAPVPAGQTAAFVVRYGAPRCTGRPGRPSLLATVDGVVRRLPLRIDLPGLLGRLRRDACAGRRLAATAGVTLRWDRRTAVRGGEEYLPGTLTLTRRSTGTAVRVVDLGGSVLFDLRPARRGALPATMDGRAARLRLAVRLVPGGRCDAHARGQSSQTFLFSVYLRRGDEPTHRTVLIPDRAVQQRMLDLLDRSCGAVRPPA